MRLIDFVIETKNLNWNVNNLIFNENITEDDIISTFDIFNYDVSKILKSKKCTIKMILCLNEKNLLKTFNLYDITKDIDFKYIEQYKNIKWPINAIIRNQNITYNFCIENVKNINWEILSLIAPLHLIKCKLPFNYFELSKNKNLTIDIVLNDLYKEWDWNSLTYLFPIEDIINHPDLPFNYYLIDVDQEFIDKHINFIFETNNKNWNWFKISTLKFNIQYLYYFSKHFKYEEMWKNLTNNFSYQEICETFDFFYWDINEFSKNKNITIEFIIQNLIDKNDKMRKWNWEYLTQNMNLEIIIKYSCLPWNYQTVSKFKNIPIEFVYNNLHKNWNFDDLSLNL